MNKEMKDLFDKWDKGILTFSDEVQEKLSELKENQKLGNIMKDCSLCVVHNATCHHYIPMKLYKYNPNKGGKTVEIWICSLGCNSENCILNK